MTSERQGQPSFEAWVSVEGRALKRAAVGLCRNEHEADELVQETLIRLFTRWERVSRMDNPAGYARRTLTNLMRSRWRRLRLELSTSNPGPVERVDEIGAVAERAAAASFLRALGPKQRAAVVWRYYCDLPIGEIAVILGCSEATVRSQLSRALSTLRRVAEAEHDLSQHEESSLNGGHHHGA